jgi:hypothetical protein
MTSSFRDDPTRKDDLFALRYALPGMTAGPIDKYTERSGPFDKALYHLFIDMHQVLVEHGKSLEEPSSRPFSSYAYSGFHHPPIAYRVLNCLVEQEVDIAYIDTRGSPYDLLYRISFIGRFAPANAVWRVLSPVAKDGFWSLDPFKEDPLKPDIRRFENKELLKPNDFDSIDSLEERLRLIATKEKRTWKWT